MSDREPSKSRSLIHRLTAAVREADDADPRARELGLRVLARAERVVDRMDGVAATLQRVADIELQLVQRMMPIVDDLGELVRHTLSEARERRGLPPRRKPTVIDHE